MVEQIRFVSLWRAALSSPSFYFADQPSWYRYGDGSYPVSPVFALLAIFLVFKIAGAVRVYSVYLHGWALNRIGCCLCLSLDSVFALISAFLFYECGGVCRLWCRKPTSANLHRCRRQCLLVCSVSALPPYGSVSYRGQPKCTLVASVCVGCHWGTTWSAIMVGPRRTLCCSACLLFCLLFCLLLTCARDTDGPIIS